jgi:hypothetical protein
MNVKDEIVHDLKTIAGVLGHTPTEREFNLKSKLFKGAYVTWKFGSWNAALYEAGLSPNLLKINSLDREALIEKIKALAEEIGHTPTQRDLYAKKKTDINYPSMSQYRRVFGSWTKALMSADLKLNRYDAEVGDRKTLVLKWIKDFYKKNKYLPSVIELQSQKKAPSHHVIRSIFGSYGNAVKAAGFMPRIPGQTRATFKGHKYEKNNTNSM